MIFLILVKKKGDLHNYADDNTLSYGSNSVDDAIETLEEQSDILIKWFTENHMLINFRPFQLVGKHMRKI